MNSASHFQVTNLSCIRQQKKLFAPVSFQLQAGQILLIEGTNGSGKSSLLRLLCGLATPYAGEIHWQDQSIHSDLGRFWENLHYVGHANGLKLGLTVEENLHLMGKLELTPWLGMTGKEITRHLSAGQKRRLALAKLFLSAKPLWILDEPLTALDQSSQQVIINAIEEHAHKGGIVIITSHQPIAFKNPNVAFLRLDS